MKEYYKTDNGTLYHGDCLEIMPKFKQKFDMILTDPPYGKLPVNGIRLFR